MGSQLPVETSFIEIHAWNICRSWDDKPNCAKIWSVKGSCWTKIQSNMNSISLHAHQELWCNICTKNKTNHPISSNSHVHPSATANKAIHCLKWGSICIGGAQPPVQKSLMFSHVTQLWINCGSGLNCMQIFFFKRDFVRSTVKYFQTWNSQVRLKQSKNSHVNLTFEKWIGKLSLA